MWFNMCYPDPAVRDAFRDRDFRVALQILINRPKINKEVFFGMAQEWRHAPKPEANPWYDEKFLKMHTEFDPEKANKMLDDAGYVDTDGDGWREDPDGRQLKLASIAYYDTETPRSGPIKIIEPEWQKAGINFTFEDVGEGSGFWPLFGAGKMSFLVWHGQFTTPTTLVMRYHGTPGTNPPNCWNTWVNTKGASGVEPPVRAWQAMDYFDRARAAGADPEERIRLGKLAMEIYAEDVYNLDTVTNFPHPVVTKNDMRNVPTREHGPLYFGYDALWMKAYNPMQLYFEGRPAVSMAESGLPARYDPAEMAKDPIDQMIERGEVSPGG
jgi:peptide/nickel transport system substrate-binding protein